MKIQLPSKYKMCEKQAILEYAKWNYRKLNQVPITDTTEITQYHSKDGYAVPTIHHTYYGSKTEEGE